ncbi:MAG: hypothetical protein GJ671_00605 [Alteromonadaceae bacterium]|nr:hypothetical protein [Alteromonadaceae bacterium]
MEIKQNQYYRRYHIILAENMFNLINEKLGRDYADSTMFINKAPSDYMKDGETLNQSIFQNLMYGEDIMLSSIERVCDYFDIDIIDALIANSPYSPDSSKDAYSARLSKNLFKYIDTLPNFMATSSTSVDDVSEKAILAMTKLPPSPSDPKLQKSLLKKALEGKDLKLSSITRICDYFDIELEMLLKP